MKLLLILLFPIFLNAQQLPVSVTINDWGGTAKGFISLPSDYNTSTKKYPVILFYHGVGESGSDPNKLLTQGLPQLLNSGMKLDSIQNPSDSQYYSFIVLSLQNQFWSPDPLGIPNEITWLKQNYRIDTSRIYTTGLSAGGEESFIADVLTDKVSSLVKATVSMSTATLPNTYDSTMVAKYKIRTWFFCGDHDERGFLPGVISYNAQCNRMYPGSSKLTIYPGGHGGWNTFYDVKYKENGINIYQWMLMSGIQKPVPAKTVVMTIKIYSDGTIEKY